MTGWIETLENAKDALHQKWEQRRDDIADESAYPAEYTMDALVMLLGPDEAAEIFGGSGGTRTAAAGKTPGGPWQLRDQNGRWVDMALVDRLIDGIVAARGGTPRAEDLKAVFEDYVSNYWGTAEPMTHPAFASDAVRWLEGRVVDTNFIGGGLSIPKGLAEAGGDLAYALQSPESPQTRDYLELADGTADVVPAYPDGRYETIEEYKAALMAMAVGEEGANAMVLGKRIAQFEQYQADQMTAAQHEVYGPFGGESLGEAGRAYASGSNGEINGFLRGHKVESDNDHALQEWRLQNGWEPEPATYSKDYEYPSAYDWGDVEDIVEEQFVFAEEEVKDFVEGKIDEGASGVLYEDLVLAVDEAVGRADLVHPDTNEDIVAADDGKTYAVDILQDNLMDSFINYGDYPVFLEGADEVATMEAFVEDFESAFTETPQDLLVTRTVDSRAVKALGFEDQLGGYEVGDDADEALIGTVWKHEAFVSTTLNNSTPIDWHDGDNHMLQIEVPAGTRAFYMPGAYPDLHFNGRENELVLPTGTELEITGVIVNPKQLTMTDLRPEYKQSDDNFKELVGEVTWLRGIERAKDVAYRDAPATDAPQEVWDEFSLKMEQELIDISDDNIAELSEQNKQEIPALVYAGTQFARDNIALVERITASSEERLMGPFREAQTLIQAKVVPEGTRLVGDIADTIRTKGGFTYDPVGEKFVTTGFQVAIPGNETRVPVEEFKVEHLDRLMDASLGKQVGGWSYEGEYVFDVSENFRDVRVAGAAMVDRGEQALYDFAGDRSVYNPARWEELEPGVYSVWEPETLEVVDRDRSSGTYVKGTDGKWRWKPNE